MIWQVALWLTIFAVCIVIEIITLGLTTIWFAGGALVATIVAMCTDSIVIQGLVFAVVSFLLLSQTRPIAKKYFDKKLEKTNIENLIGKHVIVVNEINNMNSQGTVKINDIEWTTRSVDNGIIPAGCEVEIVEISGVKLIVKKCNE